jgi:hypothetical protein
VNKGLEIVKLHDTRGDVFDGDMHVFIAIHGSVQVEVLDIDHHKVGTGCQDDAVEEAFDGGEVGCGCADVAIVFEAVTTHREVPVSKSW